MSASEFGDLAKPSSSADQLIRDGWFSETEALWPGQKFSLQVQEVLFNAKSEFQDLLLFQSTNYGKVLVLDGVIQLTERDEFAYQEMIAHLPLFAHPNPKRVLIVGGGDGGVLREVAKHPGVEKIDMCEIDQLVVEVSKKYLSDSMSTAFSDPRLNLMFADAAAYLENCVPGLYDVIICDSSDPVGPAETLFRPQFYESMQRALNDTGILCTQGECQWLHLDIIGNVLRASAEIFPVVRYAYTSIPTYPSGQIGFIICGKDSNNDVSRPQGRDGVDFSTLRYYSPRMHSAAFVLPSFAQRALDASMGQSA